jgi:hypothetical protein
VRLRAEFAAWPSPGPRPAWGNGAIRARAGENRIAEFAADDADNRSAGRLSLGVRTNSSRRTIVLGSAATR